jgi:tetratricopeptide (TPR) repeat protein
LKANTILFRPGGKEWVSLLGLMILVFIAFNQVLSFDFLNWDDDQYVLANKRYQPGTERSVISFFKGYDVGNYHPLTMLSYAIDLETSFSPKPFHRTNLLLHILNTLLVYVLLRYLKLTHWVALLSAVFFALHPHRVESVAWISDRKDLLMTVFYLLSLITFIHYTTISSYSSLLLSFIFFVAACLSKATAVTLPLVCLLYLFFYIQEKKLFRHLMLMPFFIISLIIGYVAILAQTALSAIKTTNTIPLLWKPIVACFNLGIYLLQHIAPVGLQTYYLYPEKVYYILLPLLFIVLVTIAFSVFLVVRIRNSMVSFLFLSGVVAILPVLQIIPVGDAMRADRYTYLSSAVWCALPFIFLTGIPKVRLQLMYALSLIYIAMVFSVTYRLLPSWKDSELLWKRSIAENPDWPVAYNNAGIYYINTGRIDEAKDMFHRAIAIGDLTEGASINLGFIYNTENEPDSAAYFLQQGLKIFPNQPILLNNYAYTLYLQKRYNEALRNVNRSIALKSDNAYAYRNRALIFEALKQYDASCEDTKRAVALNYVAQWGDDVLLLQQKVCGY